MHSRTPDTLAAGDKKGGTHSTRCSMAEAGERDRMKKKPHSSPPPSRYHIEHLVMMMMMMMIGGEGEKAFILVFETFAHPT